MTTQIPDRLLYQGDDYLIISAKGDGLISPSDFGMRTATNVDSACYRGYHVRYIYADEGLFLTDIVLRTSDGHFEGIYGVEPTIDTKFNTGAYSGLQVRTVFSGNLLVAKDMKKEMRRIPMPFSFDTVKELLFQDGTIVSEIDHSKRVDEILEIVKQDKSIHFWEIEWGFSQDYDLHCYWTRTDSDRKTWQDSQDKLKE